MVQGLDYLHFNAIMHGDLKPDNLLLSCEGVVKISDFGSSTVVEPGGSINMTLGTPAFMAPEMCQVRAQPYKPFPAECWALGVCLYMMVYGSGTWAANRAAASYTASFQPREGVCLLNPSRRLCDLVKLFHGLADCAAPDYLHLLKHLLSCASLPCPTSQQVHHINNCCYLLYAAPFVAEGTGKLYERIRERDVSYPSVPEISPSLRHLLSGLLTKDADERIPVAQVPSHSLILAKPCQPAGCLFHMHDALVS